MTVSMAKICCVVLFPSPQALSGSTSAQHSSSASRRVCRRLWFIGGVSFQYRFLATSIAYPPSNGNRKSCFTFRPDFAIIFPVEYAPVAQLDRVTDSDSVGQRFESARAYHEKTCREAGFFAVRRGFEVYPREGKSARAYQKTCREAGFWAFKMQNFKIQQKTGRRMVFC